MPRKTQVISILYRDDFLLAVSKPANMLVHHSNWAGRHEESSLLDCLRYQGEGTCYPLHRLDSKTSGVLLLARAKEHAPIFNELFVEKGIQKTYIALMRGWLDEQGIIDSPVRNERGNYKEALTHYTCKRKFCLDVAVEPYQQSRYSMVELFPQTGRWHQLRQHANKISHPIIGDHKHGNRHHNRLFAENWNLPDLFLHAQELSFQHPLLSKEIKIQASLPEQWILFEEIAQKLSIIE